MATSASNPSSKPAPSTESTARRWAKRAGAFAVGVATIAATVIAYLQFVRDGDGPETLVKPSSANTVNVGPAAAGYAITNVPKTGAHHYPACFTLHMTGRPPKGRTLVVRIQGLEDPRHAADHRFYFNGETRQVEPGDWEAEITLGDKTETTRTFGVSVVEMDSDLAKYLSGTSIEPGDPTWSSQEMPPTSVAVASATLPRDGTYKPC
jgi:hypothetical protein